MKTILKLMDVKTLVAGIIPVIYASLISYSYYGASSIFKMIILIVGIILLQSCANMINDLFDYSRGADGQGKSDEKALASGQVSSKQVKIIIGVFLGIDLLIALYFSLTIHFGILFICIIGGLIMYLYSAGKHPISYTPFGEIVAGLTMGFGIITTVIMIQTGMFSLNVLSVALPASIPTSIYIGTILLTNNISDQIEDKKNGRRTLPIVIGSQKADKLWQISCHMLILTSLLLVPLKLLPLEGVILAAIIIPHKKILGFRNIEKVQANKGLMMGIISQVGIKFHVGIFLGLCYTMFLKFLLEMIF